MVIAEAAASLLDATLGAARKIVQRPGLGRVRLDLAPAGCRFWPMRGFSCLLVRNAASDPPVIVRFVHQARGLPGASEQRGTAPREA